MEKAQKIVSVFQSIQRARKKMLQNVSSMTARNLVPNYNSYGTKYTENNTHIPQQPELTNLSNFAASYIPIGYCNGLSINEILLVDCTKHELSC